MTDDRPFYERKTLAEMTEAEWESLCDGCGKCCVVSLVDADDPDERVHRTCVGCRLLDVETIRCRDYANRHAKVPGCATLTAATIAELGWMPKTCAYRLIAEGGPLPEWHPLKTGDRDSTRKAGAGLHGTLVSETEIDPDDIEDYVVEWPEEAQTRG